MSKVRDFEQLPEHKIFNSGRPLIVYYVVFSCRYLTFTDILCASRLRSKLEILVGMDKSLVLVYHVDVIYVTELRRTCVVLSNKIVIKF